MRLKLVDVFSVKKVFLKKKKSCRNVSISVETFHFSKKFHFLNFVLVGKIPFSRLSFSSPYP